MTHAIFINATTDNMDTRRVCVCVCVCVCVYIYIYYIYIYAYQSVNKQEQGM